jgi:hypothetical protein
MSLTRKALVAMGIEAEKIDQIIEMHSETVEALKTERDNAKNEAKQYKADAEKLPEVEKELKDLKDNNSGDKYKEKYDTLKKEYEDFKADTTAKETKATKEKAYKTLLLECGVSNKRIDKVLKVSDVDNVELDENGNIKDAESLKKSIKDEWSDFIETTGTTGAETATPPKNTGGNMSKDDILKIENDTERQRAIAENHELFGF